MKKLTILFLLLGCQQETQYRVDPMIKPYLENFYEIASSHGINFDRSNLVIITEYGLNSQLHYVGLTTIQSNGGQRQIEFDLEFWEKSDESVREVLTLHEFGHAFLGRSHNTGFSIMNPSIGATGWPKNTDHKFLLDELFKH